MGILNVTPDSFSDGGEWFDAAGAIEHGLDLARAGADIIDVGGESTRPGSARVSEQEECRRVIPVIEELVNAGIVVSIDTMRADIAQRAIIAGASIINDVSGGLADPAMNTVAAELDVPFVVSHWRAHSDVMNHHAHYGDVVTEVCAELQQQVDSALKAGVSAQRIVVDPGLGFAKDAVHDWALLAGLRNLVHLGFPVLVGASRKRFLGRIIVDGDGNPVPASERDLATSAITALAVERGTWCVRVHSVEGSAAAVRVVSAWQNGIGLGGVR